MVTEIKNPAIEISAKQIRILNSNIKNAKGALLTIDADSKILNQLGEITISKEVTIALIGGYKNLIGTNLIDDLKSLTSHKDIRKRYLQTFISWKILDDKYPHDFILEEKEIKEIEKKTTITTQEIATNLDIEVNPKGWSLFKWIAILWSLFCFLGASIGMMGAILEYIDYMSRENSLNQFAIELGSGIGMSLWFFSWFSIAGPSALIYYLSKENK